MMPAANQETAERAAPPPPVEPAPTAPETLRRLKEGVRAGQPWQQALLEAVGLWTQPLEDFKGRIYRYMIQGEAFDWLTLAERLSSELDDLIPPDEKEDLLFEGRLPDSVPPEMFQDLLGASKYRGHLNFWYGVVVEEALQLSAEEEVRKRHTARGYADTEELVEYAFTHLYGATRIDLLDGFRHEAGIPKRRGLSLTDVKSFTYWLHKLRLKMWDPARVASDTRKGIRKLRQLEQATQPAPQPEQATQPAGNKPPTPAQPRRSRASTSKTGAPASHSRPPTSKTGAPASDSRPPTSKTGAPASDSRPPTSKTGAPASHSGPPTSKTGAPASHSREGGNLKPRSPRPSRKPPPNPNRENAPT